MADSNTHPTVQQQRTGHAKTPSSSTKRHAVVLIGGREVDVGKSALGVRYERNEFEDHYDSQFDRDAGIQKLVSIDNEAVILEIYDVDSGPAGTKDIRIKHEPYMRRGEGFILVYSIADRASFQEIPDFQEDIRRFKGLNPFPTILVGNKCDLENQRQVSIEDGREAARRLGVQFFETSAKLSINVNKVFAEIVCEIRRHTQEHPPGRKDTLQVQGPVLDRHQVGAQILQHEAADRSNTSAAPVQPTLDPVEPQSECCSGCAVA